MIKLKSESETPSRRSRLPQLFVLLVTERWRGQWALKRWKRHMADKGEIFDATRPSPRLICSIPSLNDAGISGSTRRRTLSKTLKRCSLGSASISRRISFTLSQAPNRTPPQPYHTRRHHPQMDNIKKLESDLWEAADLLRESGNVPYNEFFMPVMGILFLHHPASTPCRLLGR